MDPVTLQALVMIIGMIFIVIVVLVVDSNKQ